MSRKGSTVAGGLIAALAMIATPGCAIRARGPSDSMGPASLTVHVPPSLARKRSAYAREVRKATEQAAAFFRSCGYPMRSEGLIRTVEVLDWSESTRRNLARIWGVAPEKIPATFSGTVTGGTLYLVTRKRYREIWDELYPSWPWTRKTYHQLMVHEVAHKAHELIAISRTGSPDGMGPAWFFEGLAVLCAGQFEGREPPMSPEQIAATVGAGRTPSVSYPLYGRLVRSLATRHDLKELIARAAEPGFPESLSGSP